MSKIRTFSGSMVALVTPFTAQDTVDYNKIEELVNWHIDQGTDGIVALGTTAETPVLTEEEKEQIVALVIKTAAGRIPIIVGAGSNNTKHSLELSKKYEAMGADGLLLVSPYYNKANEEGMYAHFATVADEVNIPIILYNVPGRTGCSIPLSVVERLAKHPKITCIKEASGDMSYTIKCAKFISDSFTLVTGNDDVIVPTMAIGGSGVISVFANSCPKECHDIVALYQQGKTQESLALQLKYLEYINALFIEANPIPIKEAMGLANYRLPLCKMGESAAKVLHNAMKQVGLC